MNFTKKNLIVKLCLILIIFVLSITLIHTDTMANTRYGRLTGVNWFGFETGNYMPHGLWARDYKSVLQQIKDLGFNCIRIPWCNAMIGKTPSGIQVNAYGVDGYTKQTGMNLDLDGLDSLGILDKIIDHAGTLGLYIILDNHSRAADGYMNETLWSTAAYSESTWISDWVMMVTRYKNKANVIGADLNNEPHGNLGTGMKPPASWGYNVAGYGVTDWKAAAEKCGQAVLAVNSNLLILVEGVEQAQDGSTYWWGGNFKDVKNYPITGIPAANLVYSPHEYGSVVYNQTWFSDPSFPSNMAAIWDDNFYFIKKQNIAPLLFGEFGIKESEASNSASIDYKWLTTFMAYVGNDCSWAFWCMNPNSGDTGGILKEDWVSVNTAKYNIIKPYLAGAAPTPTPNPNATTTPVPTPTPAPVASIKVKFYNQTTAASTNQICPYFQVVNTGTSPITLSNVKIRYYYTADGTQSQNFFVNYTPLGSSNVTGTFVTMSTPKTGADTYLEVGFASGAGTLSAGTSTEIQARFAKSDWSNYTQTGDYSFNATATSYADWTTVTAYVSGALKWGTEP